MNFVLLLFLLLSSITVFAKASWQEIGWEKLLYLGKQESPGFYFSGQHPDLKTEWFATIKAMQSGQHLHTNEHPQCRFPARFIYLSKYSGEQFTLSKCPAYDQWIGSMAPSGLSLVFAGNYPENPGSVFGHTFLKVTSSPSSRLQYGNGKSNHLDILDYAINYAAMVTDKLGILYAFKGLLGGYYGFFSMDPYYVKVNDYSEGEGRDIWEYQLNLSSSETAYMLAHYWEIRYQALFTYYFLDDNCSLMILGLVDTAKPEWKLITEDPLYVIPLETVKQLRKIPGAITKTIYRPSIRNRAKDAFDSLSFSKRKLTGKLINAQKTPDEIEDGNILATGALHFYSEKSRRDLKLDQDEELLLGRILQRLSQIPNPPKDLFSSKTPISPDHSHNIRQVGLALGHQENNYTEMSLRLGVHDLMDYSVGYLEYSELEIMDAKARFEPQRFYLQQLSVFNLSLFRPLTLNMNRLSWKTKIQYQGQSQLFCESCKSFYLEAMGGASVNISPTLLCFVLLGAYMNPMSMNPFSLSYGPTAEVGFYFTPTMGWKGLLGLEAYQDLNHLQEENFQHFLQGGVAYHPRINLDLNLKIRAPIAINGSYQGATDLSLGTDFHF